MQSGDRDRLAASGKCEKAGRARAGISKPPDPAFSPNPHFVPPWRAGRLSAALVRLRHCSGSLPEPLVAKTSSRQASNFFASSTQFVSQGVSGWIA